MNEVSSVLRSFLKTWKEVYPIDYESNILGKSDELISKHRPPLLQHTNCEILFTLTRSGRFSFSLLGHMADIGNEKITALGPINDMSREEQYEKIHLISEILSLYALYTNLSATFWSIVSALYHVEQENYYSIDENWNILSIKSKTFSADNPFVKTQCAIKTFANMSRLSELYKTGPNT